MTDKFWNMLSKPTQKALKKAKCQDPWNWTLAALLKIKGIGPVAIRELAIATEKHCV